MSVVANVPRLLQSFFTDRLTRQRQASPHTIAAYRDTFRRLLEFAQKQLDKEPSSLGLEDLDTPLVGAFLDHLEKKRGNSARTRNARLAAVHSFFRSAGLQEPNQAAVIQRVLAMPSKRYTRKLVGFLTRVEIDELLAAPNRNCWPGRRDYRRVRRRLRSGLARDIVPCSSATSGRAVRQAGRDREHQLLERRPSEANGELGVGGVCQSDGFHRRWLLESDRGELTAEWAVADCRARCGPRSLQRHDPRRSADLAARRREGGCAGRSHQRRLPG
jgi:integrase